MRRLLFAAAGFAAACAVFVYLLGEGLALPAVGGCALLAALFVLLRRSWSVQAALALLGAALGFLWCLGYSGWHFGESAEQTGTSQALTVTAVEYSTPRSDTAASTRVRLTTADGAVRTAILYTNNGEMLTPGDQATGQFFVRDSRDGDLTVAAQGLQYVLTSYHPLEVIQGADQSPTYFFAHLSHRAAELCDQVFGELAYFFRGLLLGDKSEMPRGISAYFNRSGIAHVLVVSGLHVSLFVTLSGRLFKGRWLSAGFSVVTLLGYMLLVGFTPSVVRAGVMYFTVPAALLFGRDHDSLTAFGLALLLTLLQNPFAIASWSLQLSYGSCLGILLFARPMEQGFRRLYFRHVRIRTRGLAKAFGYVAASVSVSLSALVFTQPLIAVYFGQVSLFSPVANLFAVWAAGCAFPLGLAAIVAGAVFLPLGSAIGVVAGWFGQLIVAVATFFGAQSFAALPMDVMGYRVWFLFTYFMLLFLLVGRKRFPMRPVIPLCSSGILLVAVILMQSAAQQTKTLRVTMLDVGQGQSVYVETAGFTALVDCGGDYAAGVGEQAANYLRAAGKQRIDLLVLTHYDMDHAGGVPYILQWLDVGILALPDTAFNPPIRQEIETIAAQEGTALWYVTADARYTQGSCVATLYAPFDTGNSNDAGLAVLFTEEDFDVLFTGDMTYYIERRLLRYGDLPDLEVLVAGHHGSRYSTGQELLEATTPELVLISAGADNSYGHPHPDTLARIDGMGASIYRTDLQGDIILSRGDFYGG